MPSEPRFQVREIKREWMAARYVVVDTRTGKHLTGKDEQRTAEELADTLNGLWLDILTATGE